MKSYQQLEDIFKKAHHIDNASSILSWDAAVMMPEGSACLRGDVQATLAQLSYEAIANDQVGDMIAEAENHSSLNEWQRANLREMKRTYTSLKCVPIDLTKKIIQQSTNLEMLWRQARKESNYTLVLPQFKDLIRLTSEMATARGEALGLAKYDALLDSFDPGSRAKDIDPIFKKLRDFLPNFIKSVKARQSQKPEIKLALSQVFQKQIGKKFMQDFGLDFSKARLDESTHPFCGGVSDDIRITTRYDKNNFFTGLQGCLHELGHALYQQNLPSQWRSQPVGTACGMTAHESQSLFLEMQVCRSKEFLELLLSKINKSSFTLSAITSYCNYVEPSFIRVDADEVTYPLHVILRYEMEKVLISGELLADDLPYAWNEGMQKLLGITPKHDRDGCLQDIHWYSGLFGYFPCYTLGAATAAQLMHTLKQEQPDVKQRLKRGELKFIIDWLNERIHSQGSFYSRSDLIVSATKEKLNPQYFIDYLQEKYLPKV